MKQLTNSDLTKELRTKLFALYDKGITKYQLSYWLSVSEKTIYKWEYGSIPNATNYLNLLSICKENGIS